jgi:hypothetical protein
MRFTKIEAQILFVSVPVKKYTRGEKTVIKHCGEYQLPI